MAMEITDFPMGSKAFSNRCVGHFATQTPFVTSTYDRSIPFKSPSSAITARISFLYVT